MSRVNPLLGLAVLLLASPAAAAPPIEDVVRPLLAEPAIELAHVETRALPSGHRVVRFRQTHRGLPVVGHGASVLARKDGSPSPVRTSVLLRDLPSDVAPDIGMVAAKSIASARAKVSFDDPTLVVFPSLGHGRLAWYFYRPAVAPNVPYAPLVVVDAKNGDVLLARNAIAELHQAKVQEFNPVVTPTPIPVTLDVDASAKTLVSPLVESRNCIDEHTTVSVGGTTFHTCKLEQKATADASGDFTAYTYQSDTDPEDAYAEVALYYHVKKAYAFHQGLGMPELATKPIPAVANLRVPAGFATGDLAMEADPSLSLEPFDNAFYSAASPLYDAVFGIPGEAMFFFQGHHADFSYDGDVVYHELTHGFLGRTIQLVGTFYFDPQGAAPMPGAMAEALADYFSCAITGDPNVGEYASNGLAPAGAKVIRSLDNADSCPANVQGEPHADSTLFSGALWSVRASLSDGDRKKLDGAIAAALIASTTGYLSYDTLASLLVAAAKEMVSQAAADALTAEFTKRNVLPGCIRIHDLQGAPITSPSAATGFAFVAASFGTAGVPTLAPFVPPVTQFHLGLPSRTGGTLTVTFSGTSESTVGIGAGTWAPVVLAKFAGSVAASPIVFSYDGPELVSSDASAIAAVSTSSAPLGFVATIDVPRETTDVGFAIVNEGNGDGLYTNVNATFAATPIPPEAGGSGGEAGSGGEGGSSGETAGTSDSSVGSAAAAPRPVLSRTDGCDAAGDAGYVVPFALLALVGAARKLRDRARTSR